MIFVINYGGIYIQKTTRTLAIILVLAAVILACGCAGKDSATDNLKIEGTVECLENPDSIYNVQYRVNFTFVNEGPAPVTFDYMTVAFENNIERRADNLLVHDFTQTTLEPGIPKSYSFTTGIETDRLLEASENGKMDLGILLYKDEVIYFRIAELPRLITKNGDEAELRPGEIKTLEFAEEENA